MCSRGGGWKGEVRRGCWMWPEVIRTGITVSAYTAMFIITYRNHNFAVVQFNKPDSGQVSSIDNLLGENWV